MKQAYHKLVRDGIPDIIRKNGGKPKTHELSLEEFRVELLRKFREELEEFAAVETSADQLEEMADVFEVITALNEVDGRSLEAVVGRQKEKREKRGGFAKRIFLESVDEAE
jgi:predicted house-cleaning noncanonical NTP pyrophosphatase (MazG superfamily)